jgi:hypothetical protein
MSEDGSGYIDPKAVSEGELISKSEINQTAEAWNYVEERVSDINIREEGLSRINFDADSTWGDDAGSSSRCHVSALRKAWPPLSEHGWQKVWFGFNSVGGGISDDYASIQFDWDPQEHTYAIIRASLSFEYDVGLLGDSGRANSDIACSAVKGRLNKDFRFGILVHKVGETPIPMTHTINTLTGDVYSPVQIGLNPDFSETANGARGPIKFKYDRRSNMTGTISMVVGGQSWETESCPNLNANYCGLDLREAGPYQAHLVWMGRSDVAEEGGLTSFTGKVIECDIGRLNMFAQIFRR